MSDISVAGIGAAIGAFITGLFAWLIQRAKGNTDQEIAAAASKAAIEVAVMAEWQKLNTALAQRISDLEAELAQVRRDCANEMEEMRAKHNAEMKVLRDLNEGLQRMIAQNSQSSAILIGKSPVVGSQSKDNGK